MSSISRKRGRQLLLAIGTAAIAAGLVVASVSAKSGPHRRHAAHARAVRAHSERGSARSDGLGQRSIAAGYLGLTRAQLRGKLHSGQTLAQIANATPGKSASGLIAALVSADQRAHAASMRSRITLAVDGVRTSLGRPAAAGYLGVSVAKLRRELRSGKSLAQIASATSGKSASGLADALASAREAQIEAAVSSGALGQDAADAYLSKLRERITREVQRTRRRPAR